MNPLIQETEKPDYLRPHQAKFVKEHCHCAICETKLEIHHDINSMDSTVKEEAYCSTCGIRARAASYKLN